MGSYMSLESYQNNRAEDNRHENFYCLAQVPQGGLFSESLHRSRMGELDIAMQAGSRRVRRHAVEALECF